MNNNNKKVYDTYLDTRMQELWDLSLYIHDNPEIAYQEYKACEAQCSFLEGEGFDVKRNPGGLDTAFVASYGHGYPRIAVLSEYDALKELGHGCGHNLISVSALATGIVVKKYLEENKQSGEILVIGTPAEEGGGGKIKMLEKNVFNNIDSVFMMHPTSDKTRLAGECMSNTRLQLTFHGKSAHAGSHPENGLNALSAANIFLSAIGLWRQHFKSDMRVSMIITNGGEAPGMIPDKINLAGSLSCFGKNDLEWLEKTMHKCAKGCADAFGVTLDFTSEIGYLGRIPNKVLSDVCKGELELLNEPLLDGMPADFGGEDLGNVSREIPICNPYVTIFPEYKISGHTEQFKELSKSEAGKRCIEITGKSMSRSIIDLFEDNSIIDESKKELANRLKKETV
ncbi:MAG: M20 family metallopeptidase [Erysipelotrichaceae bacterium]